MVRTGTSATSVIDVWHMSSDLQPTVQAHHKPENTRSANKSTEDRKLAAVVTKELETGNFKAAIRIICSSYTPAPGREETLKALKTKHLSPATDRRTPCDPDGNPRFEPLQVTKEDVQKALRSFPAGSSGGPDELTPQHVSWLVQLTSAHCTR